MKRSVRKALLALDGVTSVCSREVECVLYNEHGKVDHDATEELADKVHELTGWGGYRCGYGGWLLRKGYEVSEHDYCSVYSPHHY